MNKTLLLASVATALFAISANATDFNPYVSAKAAWLKTQDNVKTHILYTKTDGKTKAAGTYDEDHKDSVWGLRLAAGASTPVKYGKLRTELEFGWNDDAKDSHNSFFKSTSNSYNYKLENKLSVYATMINVYYDIDTGTKFTPYVGAGLGIAHLKNKLNVTATTPKVPFPINVSDTEEENHFAWNIGLGMNYALTDNISLDLGYRYTNYGRIQKARSMSMAAYNSKMGTLGAIGKVKVESHEALLGVRYAF